MNEIQIVEYKGERVLTSRQIAEMYGTDSKTISKNFNRNKDRYTEGKHYFLLKGQELRSFLQSDENIPKVPRLYLWTKKGAFHHAKSLNTDTAWEVYERLVDFYFEKKENLIPQNIQTPTAIPTQSGTPVPKRPDWYNRNRKRILNICEKRNITHKEIYHFILSALSEKYDIKGANEIYRREKGYSPEYQMDIVGYFPELAREADKMLDWLEMK